MKHVIHADSETTDAALSIHEEMRVHNNRIRLKVESLAQEVDSAYEIARKIESKNKSLAIALMKDVSNYHQAKWREIFNILKDKDLLPEDHHSFDDDSWFISVNTDTHTPTFECSRTTNKERKLLAQNCQNTVH